MHSAQRAVTISRHQTAQAEHRRRTTAERSGAGQRVGHTTEAETLGAAWSPGRGSTFSQQKDSTQRDRLRSLLASEQQAKRDFDNVHLESTAQNSAAKRTRLTPRTAPTADRQHRDAHPQRHDHDRTTADQHNRRTSTPGASPPGWVTDRFAYRRSVSVTPEMPQRAACGGAWFGLSVRWDRVRAMARLTQKARPVMGIHPHHRTPHFHPRGVFSPFCQPGSNLRCHHRFFNGAHFRRQ